MNLRPITLREANDFVENFHRHNKPVIGARFAIGLVHDHELKGVAIVGRPISRVLQDGFTAEVLRVCCKDCPGASSKLYAACWRAWRAMGGMKLITYTLKTESGSSLRASGFELIAEVPAGDWDRVKRRREWQPVMGQAKFRWEIS